MEKDYTALPSSPLDKLGHLAQTRGDNFCCHVRTFEHRWNACVAACVAGGGYCPQHSLAASPTDHHGVPPRARSSFLLPSPSLAVDDLCSTLSRMESNEYREDEQTSGSATNEEPGPPGTRYVRGENRSNRPAV